MGPDRKDKLGTDDRIGSLQQGSTSVRLTSKRLVEEARELLQKSRTLVNEASAITSAGWTFTAKCAEGHEVVAPAYHRSVIIKQLQSRGALPLYCTVCDRYWNATEEQRAKLEWALRNTQF